MERERNSVISRNKARVNSECDIKTNEIHFIKLGETKLKGIWQQFVTVVNLNHQHTCIHT